MSDTPTIRVLSLGAGRQSTTIALLSAEGVLPKLDAAIFADTGWEPQGVYDHLDRLERDVLKPAGIPLYRVSNGNLRDDVLNPNKMRSIPAHTLGPAHEVEYIDEWKLCPDPGCGWRRLREVKYTAVDEEDAALFDITPADTGDMGGLFDCVTLVPPLSTLDDLDALAAQWEPHWDEDGGDINDAALVATALRRGGLDQLPEQHDACRSRGLVVARSHTTIERDRGMLNRRCTQTYKLQPILEQVRLLLGAKVGEERLCKKCDGAGERNAPWRAKLGDYATGPCSVCDGTGVISRVGQPPAGAWAEQWIGFSTDEVERVSNRGDTRYSRSRYPLLELEMSVTQCLAFLKSKGWDETKKSACVGCPFHGNAAWRQMRDTCGCGHHRDAHTREVDGQLRCTQMLPHYRWATVGATCTCEGFYALDWDSAVKFDEEYRTGPGMRHERFLHISRVPLDLAPIDRVRRVENLQPTFMDASVELDLERLENGDPDGCSPWACRSGEPVTVLAPLVQAATDAAAEGIDPNSASAASTGSAGLSRTSPEVPDA